MLDISCVPRKSFFEFLVHFTADEQEREKFEEFVSLSAEGASDSFYLPVTLLQQTYAGQDELYEYTNRVRRTILEVLLDFRHVSIPLDYIFDLFPLIRPRQFSIASSSRFGIGERSSIAEASSSVPTQRGTSMDLCVAIVQYKTRLKAPRRGLCTTWLAGLQPSEDSPCRIRVGLRKGALKLPPSKEGSDAPVICIGPGTGVAPMRAIIQERISRGQKGE